LDGIEVARRLRKLSEGPATPPQITRYQANSDASQTRKSGDQSGEQMCPNVTTLAQLGLLIPGL